MQRLISGYIEALRLFDDLWLICNEEGKIDHLPPDRQVGNDMIVGNLSSPPARARNSSI